MKLSLLALFAFLAVAFAVKGSKGRTYLVTFPDDTPQSEVDKAADEIKKSGGLINHRYTLLKGFSVLANPDMMTTFKASGNQKYPANVEEDQVVYAMGDDDPAA